MELYLQFVINGVDELAALLIDEVKKVHVATLGQSVNYATIVIIMGPWVVGDDSGKDTAGVVESRKEI